jgi:hypothetical protein
MAGMCVALALAAACSGSSSKAQPAPLVEKSSAIAEGDAICKQLATDIPQLVNTFRSAHPAPTDADARDFLVNTLLPRVDVAEGAIHRIGEPTKDRPAFDAAVIALDKDVSALRESVGQDAVRVVSAPVVVFDKSARLFTDYGFKECGKKPTP